MDVQLDKEKHMENAKAQKQTEPERAEAERVEAEVVYAPMVAEPQEYQYNADAFEARGVDEVKQEAADYIFWNSSGMISRIIPQRNSCSVMDSVNS